MITVRNPYTGQEYRGRSVDSIARRIYGRRAETRVEHDNAFDSSPVRLQVLSPAKFGGWNVLARWVCSWEDLQA